MSNIYIKLSSNINAICGLTNMIFGNETAQLNMYRKYHSFI